MRTEDLIEAISRVDKLDAEHTGSVVHAARIGVLHL
jgi:hypothetical protein